MNNTLDFNPDSDLFADFPPEFQAQLREILSQQLPPQLQTQLQSLLSQSISLTIAQVDVSLIPILSTCAAFGYFIGDWTSCLVDEAKILRQILEGKSKPAHYFYFLARVSGFISILLFLLFTTNGRSTQDLFNCFAVSKIFWAFNVIALGSSYALLALRASALLGKKPIFTYIIYSAATLTTLTYITGVVGIDGAQTFTGFISCTLYPIKKYVAISYLISFIYDFLITFSSIFGLIYSTRNRQATLIGPNSSFLRKIILGNSIYFLVLILISLGSGILPLVNVNPGVIAVLSAPHTAATVCMSLKIFRHLRSSIINPQVKQNKIPGNSGSGGSGGSGGSEQPIKEGLNSNPSRQASFTNPSRQNSFSSNRSPVFKISRNDEINMRTLEYESDDFERLKDPRF